MHALYTVLYWFALFSPLFVNGYICLASYLWQRKCNEAIYAELEAIRGMRALGDLQPRLFRRLEHFCSSCGRVMNSF